jgi:hypothetical protein
MALLGLEGLYAIFGIYDRCAELEVSRSLAQRAPALKGAR